MILAFTGKQDLTLIGVSVLTLAALEQLAPYLEHGRIGLVTCGSPLRRLYARYYPAYVTPELMDRCPGQSVLTKLSLAGNWRNVYRPSDPIGSWVRDDVPPGRREIQDGAGHADERAVPRLDGPDHCLLDPDGFGPHPGDLSLPATHGHGGYFADKRLISHVNHIANRLVPASTLRPRIHRVPSRTTSPAGFRRRRGSPRY